MASLNKTMIIGNLGKDPELRYSAEGDPVCNFSVAATDKWTAKDGTKKEEVTWFRVSFWGKLAEVCGTFLKKGAQVYVEGSIRTRKYTDKDGAQRDTWEVRGEKMVMLGRKDDGGTFREPPQQEPAQRQEPNSTPPPAVATKPAFQMTRSPGEPHPAVAAGAGDGVPF